MFRIGCVFAVLTINTIRSSASAQQITVRDSNALHGAIRKLKPGDELLLAPGTYSPNVRILV